MNRHTAHVSRVGLVIIGLILLLGGGAVLARGLDASASVLGSSQAPLLTHAQVEYPAHNGWVWPVVAAGSAIIAALALWWMTAQTSTKTVRRLPVEPDRLHGTTVLRADAATGAIAGELESYASIRSADAVLRGSTVTPDLRLSVVAENRADPAALRARIETEALPHMRTALERDTIPTVLRLGFSRAFDRHLALSASAPILIRTVSVRYPHPYPRRIRDRPGCRGYDVSAPASRGRKAANGLVTTSSRDAKR